MQSLIDLRDALLAIGLPVFQTYGDQTDRYIVYDEDGQIKSEADDRTDAKGLTGTVDLFTKNARDPACALIEAALDELEGFAWRKESKQYEPETKYHHHEWSWESDYT